MRLALKSKSSFPPRSIFQGLAPFPLFLPTSVPPAPGRLLLDPLPPPSPSLTPSLPAGARKRRRRDVLMLTADAFSHSARSFAPQRPPVYIGGYLRWLARSISTTSLSVCVSACLHSATADGDFLTSFSQVLACVSVLFSYRLCRAELSTHVFTSVLLSCLLLFLNRRRATEFLLTGSINYCVLLYTSIHNPNQANWPLYFV